MAWRCGGQSEVTWLSVVACVVALAIVKPCSISGADGIIRPRSGPQPRSWSFT